MEKYLTTKNYDICGHGILRTARIILFGKIIPIGNLFGGAGMRCLLVLCMQHSIGRYIYSFLVRNEERIPLLQRVSRRL